MTEFKTAKDTLVASLFELSKAAKEAATAAIDFYKFAHIDDDQQPNLALKTIAQTGDIVNGHKELAEIAAAAAAAKEAAALAEIPKKKKKKAQRDPNAPKKPLTMYFAFSFHTRKEIAEERKRKGLSSLSAIDMNSLVKDRWNEITDKEKQEWQQKYRDQLKVYNVEKEKYKSGLSAAPADGSSQPAIELADVDTDEEEVSVPKLDTPKKSHKKRKSDKEKSEKKEKKKKLSTSE
ncbi:Transcriptional regulator HMO1 [Spathaspora sp. JA1]|nr:Transcriptional regulator HMO1 [Spathaspora sp. JA1]